MNHIKPRQLNHFDYASVAQRAGLVESELTAIERGTRCEYGSDEMLFELRMLRTCQAILDHQTTARQILDELNEGDVSAA